MNGNGELKETKNVIFLRKLRSSYGILTDERNSYVLCYSYDNGYGNGYGTLEIRHRFSKMLVMDPYVHTFITL